MRQTDSRCVQVLLRLALYSGEVYRAPRGCTAVRVRSGMAWGTHGGRDIVVNAGQEAGLGADRDFAIVSALGGRPLVIELMGHERSIPHRVSGAVLCSARGELPNTT